MCPTYDDKPVNRLTILMIGDAARYHQDGVQRRELEPRVDDGGWSEAAGTTFPSLAELELQ